MHPALRRIDHRPWALPQRPWSWRQSWCDLLFAHWPIPAETLRPLVPTSLAVQEFEGTSWLGVVPFQMRGVMRRPLPDLPWISEFPEVNLRLYVEHGGKPGVFFLSLDAANPLAVWAGRTLFHLPYARAKMSVDIAPDGVRYRSVRLGSAMPVVFDAVYHAASAPYEALPGSLEHWLTERYCLYAQSPRGTLYRGEVHHVPWPLQTATLDLHENDLLAPHGLSVSDPPALVHFARRLDVVLWSFERVS
jgi:uncharacterized protein YqjF (DUF2071 family)